MQEPRILLIVKAPRGLVVRDTPRPESQGGRQIRAVGVGTALYAYRIHNIDGVDYARLVPQNPQKPEWVRVAEADHSVEYVDVINLESGESESPYNSLANAIHDLSGAIRELANKK